MKFIDKNILFEITKEIDLYKKLGKLVTYIIINETDSIQLVKEMGKAKLIPPDSIPKKLQIKGLRVIRTKDLPEGYFDLVTS